MKGKVYVVGAGPGDPGLLTLRAYRVLRRADVVFYDRLVHPVLLTFCRPGARRIYVGKEPGKPRLDVPAIVHRMAAEARAGRRVVRLKGGDPFVLGRGGEEVILLAQIGVPYEVIPGITSAVAVPAYAGIPVTHRDLARGFVVETGHGRDGEPVRIAPISPETGLTRVFLMVLGNLEVVVEQLLSQGYDPATPAALIHWGTTPAQRTWVAPLADMGRLAQVHGVCPPVLLIVGDVVRVRSMLKSFESSPWLRQRVLIPWLSGPIRPPVYGWWRRGAEPVVWTVGSLEPETTALNRLQEIRSLAEGWVIRSPWAVSILWDYLKSLGKDGRFLGDHPILVPSRSVQWALRRLGIRAELISHRRLPAGRWVVITDDAHPTRSRQTWVVLSIGRWVASRSPMPDGPFDLIDAADPALLLRVARTSTVQARLRECPVLARCNRDAARLRRAGFQVITGPEAFIQTIERRAP